MSARHVVWIGAAGTVTGHGIARQIRAAWRTDVTIVAADTNPQTLVAASELADEFERIPPLADREAFVSALAVGFERHGVDTYVPLLVDEIAIAAELAAEGALGSVGVLAPHPDTARLCTDKLALAERLVAAGIPVPPTVPASRAVWWPEGVVVKDRGGEGSRGVERLDDPSDLERARTRGHTAVAQRRCDGPEVTVDAFRARGRDAWEAVCRERLEVKAGVCTKARLFRDQELEGIVRDVAEALDLRGAMCVQAMRGPAGWEITDVNPRSGGATAMSAAVGVDTIAAGLADMWGEDPYAHLKPFAGQAHVVRYYQESVRPLPPVLALDLDGTLLSCEDRQVAIALDVMDGVDGARFWADKQAGATTAAALSAQGCNDANAAARWVAQIEREDWLALDRPLPGAAEAVSEARRRGLRVVILTARRDPEAVRRQVAEHHLADPSDVLVVDPADASSQKGRILRELGAIGFVGDTESDARAADLAGVPFACVAGGQRSASFLLDQGLRPVAGGVLAAVQALLDPRGRAAAVEQSEG